jgi:organic hydroperoxide reductase OsmC/OhrA
MNEKHRVTLDFEEGYRCRATFANVPEADSLVMDEPPPLGAGSGPNANDLLGAAIGNCLAASLLFCLKKSRADVRGLSATVTTHTERNEAGRLRISHVDVELSPTLSPADGAKLDRCAGLFEDFCTITASIRAGVQVNVALKPS